MKAGKQQQQHIEMEDEEIQMDDNLEEETSPSQVGRELYQADTLNNKMKVEKQIQQQQLQKNAIDEKQSQQSATNNNTEQVKESITLKEKLLQMFTNIRKDKKSEDSSGNSSSKQLTSNEGQGKKKNNQEDHTLKENIMQNAEKNGDRKAVFLIDNDVDIYADEEDRRDPARDEETEKIRREQAEMEQKRLDKTKQAHNLRNKHMQQRHNKQHEHAKAEKDHEIEVDEKKEVDIDLEAEEGHDHGLISGSLKQPSQNEKQDSSNLLNLLSLYENIKIVPIVQNQNKQIAEQAEENEQNQQDVLSSGLKEFFQISNGSSKGTVMKIPEDKVFKCLKEPKKDTGLFSFFARSVTRYLVFCVENDQKFLCVAEKINGQNSEEYKLKSTSVLNDLYLIYSDKSSTALRMCFLNQQHQQNLMPRRKFYNVTNKLQFLRSLENAMKTIGKKFKQVELPM